VVLAQIINNSTIKRNGRECEKGANGEKETTIKLA
jgi:hypothetical protein